MLRLPRHQQLPAADRLSDGDGPCGRFVLTDHPARRRHLGHRVYQRSRHRTRIQRAQHLPRQNPFEKQARRLRLIATEACRAGAPTPRASGSGCGPHRHPPEVIRSETEAALAVIGCSPLLDQKGRGAIRSTSAAARPAGSVERDPEEQNPTPRSRHGCRSRSASHAGRAFRRQERYEESYALMVQEVAQAHRAVCDRTWRRSGGHAFAPGLRDRDDAAGVHLNLARYERRAGSTRLDGDGDVTATIARLLGMSYQERANNNCISVERADLVLAGCAILDAIRRAFSAAALARRRSRFARGHAGRDDARGRAAQRQPIGAPTAVC